MKEYHVGVDSNVLTKTEYAKLLYDFGKALGWDPDDIACLDRALIDELYALIRMRTSSRKEGAMPKDEQKLSTLREAVAYFADRNTETGAAVAALVAHVATNPKIWNSVLSDDPPLARQMLNAALTHRWHSQRPPVPDLPSGDTPEDAAKRAAGLRRHSQTYLQTIMSWPVYGGMRLSECKRADLDKSIAARHDQVEAERRNITFETSVRDALPNKNVTVGKALSPEAVMEMYQRSRAG